MSFLDRRRRPKWFVCFVFVLWFCLNLGRKQGFEQLLALQSKLYLNAVKLRRAEGEMDGLRRALSSRGGDEANDDDVAIGVVSRQLVDFLLSLTLIVVA